MSGALRFDDRVVVVTGAGAGLGRAYALEFAKRGAKIVVNDLGVSVAGEGTSTSAADSVVEEIKKLGGQAVANYDSVEFGDKIIKTALDAFGKVDIVINNAGILRDASMLKMKEEDWDIIMKVHLKGSFMVTRAAWPHMRNNKYGRIINTASGSGLFGNFGQANYATAKLGLHGLTQTLAKEGERSNIRVNTIAPIAASRMTEGILPPDIMNLFVAERVVPLVVYLAHESCEESGRVFEVGGGYQARLRWQRAAGAFFPDSHTAEDIRDHYKNIDNFDNPDYPTELVDTLSKVVQLRDSHAKPNKTSAPIDAHTIFGMMKTYFDKGEAAEKLAKVDSIFHFEVKKPDGSVQSYTVNCKGKGSVAAGKEGQSDAIFILNESDLVAVAEGKLNPQVAFMQGKMKIRGSMGKATKFTPDLFPPPTAENLAKYQASKL
jgi:3-hydroxyacyl-CoA dehydrogenase/3a,7a,12a-trihydroxy-5b-cholest-24-enoyl-CoA hydratase